MATYSSSLAQLCFGEGKTLKKKKNTAGMCGECSQWIDHTGLPQPKVACTSQVHTVQSPECSARALSQVRPAFCARPRSKSLRFSSALQGHRPRWAVCFVPFFHPSCSGDQVLGECSVPGGSFVLCTSLIPDAQFPGCALRAQYQVCCVPLWGAYLRL